MTVIPRQGRDILSFVTQQQYNNWLSAEAERVLRAALRDVMREFIAEYDGLTLARRQQLLLSSARIRAILGKAQADLVVWHEAQMAAFAGVESDIVRAELQAMLGPSLPLPRLSDTTVNAIAGFHVNGLDIGEWWERAIQTLATETKQQIQIGLLQGETLEQIVRRIRPDRTAVDATVFKRSVMRMRALVRTITTSVQNRAHEAFFRSLGSEITASYEYSATLDARTSDICRGFDAQVYLYSDPKAPRPPQHINCRSVIIPVLNMKKLPKAARVYALSQGVGPDGIMPAPPGRFRDYTHWLRAQPAAVQNEILGRGRAELFRNQEVSLRDMITSDRRRVSLEGLRRLRQSAIPQ